MECISITTEIISLLLALLSHLIRSTVEYHLKHPHYATLMQENTWSLAFTWLCDWNEGLLRLGIITRLFRAGGTACHGCSQISGRLRFGTANHRLIKLVPSPVCNPRRQFHCFISDTKLFCWCSILRYQAQKRMPPMIISWNYPISTCIYLCFSNCFHCTFYNNDHVYLYAAL